MKEDIILITGGDGNIAKQIVKTYLKKGCKVIATDINEKSSCEEFYDNNNYGYIDFNDIVKNNNNKKYIKKNSFNS